MPSSQLKRLKASLREQGIVGPQKSKKQKRAAAQQARGGQDAGGPEKRVHRSVALESIRQQFNPFDLKLNARGPKFDVTTTRPERGGAKGGVMGRPGAAKSLAEERRRKTLLVEMQRKNKVGGLLDRRQGGDDEADDDVIMERFAREKQRSHRHAMFNLEDDATDKALLTHGGRALDLSRPVLEDDDGNRPMLRDDFDEDLSDGSEGSVDERKKRKRMQLQDDDEVMGEDDDNDDGAPERKKSRKEVMEEVIAKSKLYKAKRQADQEAADDLREDLDKQMAEIRGLLLDDDRVRDGGGGAPQGKYDVAVIAGKDKAVFDREFDVQVRMLQNDKRARPADRTRTEEEVAAEEKEKLKKLEEERMRRMEGVVESEEEEDDEKDIVPEDMFEEDDGFGLGKGIRTKPTATELGFDDEDDFLIDHDLVASGSELEWEEDDGEDIDSEGEEEDDNEDNNEDGDDDDEFAAQFLTQEARDQALASEKSDVPCPQTLAELVAIMATVPADGIPPLIQQIRAIYHPRFDALHKERLHNFSTALVDYIALERTPESPPFVVVEAMARHIHSLAKTFCCIPVARRVRQHIATASKERPLALHTGDLVLLAAVGAIFPTSDHFHQVVTPAMLLVGRYLGQKICASLQDLATGAFLAVLTLQYQRLARRFVPELVNFCLGGLLALAPAPATDRLGDFPVHAAFPGSRIILSEESVEIRKLSFDDCTLSSPSQKVAIAATLIQVVASAAETWATKPSFIETFSPAVAVLTHFSPTKSSPLTPLVTRTLTHLSIQLTTSRLARRPLQLHHHRPLAIKSHTPQFEHTADSSFNPHKNYDPDQDRAQLARLKAEHKRERKGAMRELRRDAAFIMRENLRVKKARDDAYEKKHARILAEIQTEAGQEKNEYAREKKARVRANKRARG